MGTAGELVTVAAGDDAGKVRVITLDRPDKLNAFNTALYNAAGDALQAAADDDGVSVVVLTGNGRAFSAGQDLHEMAAQAAGTAPAANPTAAPPDGPSGFPRFVDALQAFPKPVVAAVNGLAVGIGFTLLISSGVASALGEVGLIRPVLAGWAPPLLLGLIVLGLAMRAGWRGTRRASR